MKCVWLSQSRITCPFSFEQLFWSILVSWSGCCFPSHYHAIRMCHEAYETKVNTATCSSISGSAVSQARVSDMSNPSWQSRINSCVRSAVYVIRVECFYFLTIIRWESSKWHDLVDKVMDVRDREVEGKLPKGKEGKNESAGDGVEWMMHHMRIRSQ